MSHWAVWCTRILDQSLRITILLLWSVSENWDGCCWTLNEFHPNLLSWHVLRYRWISLGPTCFITHYKLLCSPVRHGLVHEFGLKVTLTGPLTVVHDETLFPRDICTWETVEHVTCDRSICFPFHSTTCRDGEHSSSKSCKTTKM